MFPFLSDSYYAILLDTGTWMLSLFFSGLSFPASVYFNLSYSIHTEIRFCGILVMVYELDRVNIYKEQSDSIISNNN